MEEQSKTTGWAATTDLGQVKARNMWMKLLYNVQDHVVGRLKGYVHWFQPIHARPCLCAWGHRTKGRTTQFLGIPSFARVNEMKSDEKESSKELYIHLCETLEAIQAKKKGIYRIS